MTVPRSIAKLGETKVTLPLAVIAGIAVLAFKVDDISVRYLDEFFFSEAEAETLNGTVSGLQTKVNEMTSALKEGQVAAVETEIFKLRIEHCMASGPVKSVYAEQLAQLVGKWQKLTGSSGNPPTYVDCRDLG